MKMIALTGANENTMAAACEQLLSASTHGDLKLSVAVNVHDAVGAQVVYADGGELWRIGPDDSRPELDVLVDRQLADDTPARLEAEVDRALARFLGKTRVAA